MNKMILGLLRIFVMVLISPLLFLLSIIDMLRIIGGEDAGKAYIFVLIDWVFHLGESDQYE